MSGSTPTTVYTYPSGATLTTSQVAAAQGLLANGQSGRCRYGNLQSSPAVFSDPDDAVSRIGPDTILYHGATQGIKLKSKASCPVTTCLDCGLDKGIKEKEKFLSSPDHYLILIAEVERGAICGFPERRIAALRKAADLLLIGAFAPLCAAAAIDYGPGQPHHAV